MMANRSTPAHLARTRRTAAAQLVLLAVLAAPLRAQASDDVESHYVIQGRVTVTVEVVRAATTPAPAAQTLADAGAEPRRLEPASPLRFETDRAEPLPESLPALHELAATLRSHPGFQLRIEAHTDDLGSEALNQSLSRQRAAWVFRWLAAHGVSSDRLTSVGFGATRPVAPNDSEAGRQLNRRVDFVLVASR